MGGRIVAERHEEMKKGQAERLFPMLEEVLGEVGAVWSELDAIGVGVGPGNFTGIRISVSAARGLALGLTIPVIGVSTFEVARPPADAEDRPGSWTGYLPAPQEKAYAQDFNNGAPVNEPRIVGGSEDAPTQDAFMTVDWAGETLHALVMLARDKYLATETLSPPAPLYIKPPDAAPSSDPPPVILS